MYPQQSKLYNRMTESQGRSKLATELMVYHMQVCVLVQAAKKGAVKFVLSYPP